MARITFNFSGYVLGADISTVTVVETGKEISVNGIPADQVVENLRNGTWSIALGDFLYDRRRDADIDLSNFAAD